MAPFGGRFKTSHRGTSRCRKREPSTPSMADDGSSLRMRSRRPVTSWSCDGRPPTSACSGSPPSGSARAIRSPACAHAVGAPTGPPRGRAAGSSCSSRSNPPSAAAHAGADSRSDGARQRGPAAARGDRHRRGGGGDTGSSSGRRRPGSTPAAHSPRASAQGGRQLSAWRMRPSSSDRVWMAPAGQGRCSVGGSGRSRPCVRRLICSVAAARPDEVRRRSGPDQWHALVGAPVRTGCPDCRIAVLSPSPHVAPHLLAAGPGRRCLSDRSGPVALAGPDQSPDDPCHSVGQCDGDDLHGLSL